MGYLYIFATISFTVMGQLIGKWRMTSLADQIPAEPVLKLKFIFFKLIWDPYIVLCYLSAFLASIFWLLAVAKLELSQAYPFMSLAFVAVFILSVIFFGETVTIAKIAAMLMIISGLVIMYKF